MKKYFILAAMLLVGISLSNATTTLSRDEPPTENNTGGESGGGNNSGGNSNNNEIGNNNSNSSANLDDEDKDVVMEAKKHYFISPDLEFERSIIVPVVEATFNEATDLVVLQLCHIGDASIYIVDRYGVVADSAVVDASGYVSITLSAAMCQGCFYIVVDAQVVYAEGFVTR